MELETGNLGAKILNGGVWAALGTFLGACVTAWRASKRDESDNTFATLGAINKSSEILMNSLLQSQKQLTQELRATRRDLAATDKKLDECEAKHRGAEDRIASLERQLAATQSLAVTTTTTTLVQPVAQNGE